MSSDAQKRATQKYNRKAYDTIAIRLPKGWKDAVKAAASNKGKSLAGYIREAVDDKIRRNSKGENENVDKRKSPRSGRKDAEKS